MKNLELPIDQIEVGTRFRKDYGDISQLCYSIKTKGLITPIAVGISSKVKLKVETNKPYLLLAGGRRIKACKSLGWTTIPVRIYTQELNELEMRSIELAENFDRKNMSYVEEVALMKEINDLQISIHGAKISKDPNDPGWSQADTAKLLSKSPATVTTDLKLADAITNHPELQLNKCKNKSEALKRLKSVGRLLSNKLQAEKYKAEVTNPNTLFSKLSSSFLIEDCFNVMKKIPSNSLHLVEADPPYGIDLTNTKKNNECLGYNEIPAKEYPSFLKRFFSECYRILRPDGWFITWYAIVWHTEVLASLREAGFKLQGVPALWIKPGTSPSNSPRRNLGNSFEPFFYCRKESSELNTPGAPNVFAFKPTPPTQKWHPTQRPLDLMTSLYSTFVGPGSSGYIPFLGSGIGLIAGHLTSIKMFGSELNQDYKDGFILYLKDSIKKGDLT